MLVGNVFHINYIILIISILRTILLLFACPEAELMRTVVTVRYELLRNVPTKFPRGVGQIENLSYTSCSALTRALDKW